MFLRHERSQSCTRFFFRLICFFSSYSFPPREITVLWDDERTYYLYTRAILYAEQRRKKKKKQNRTFCRFERVPRTIRNRKQTVHANRLHNSFSLFHSFSLTLFLFVSLSLSLSLSLLNSKNKRGNFATVCKTNGKKIFFFLLFLFLFFLFKTVDSLTHRKRTILFFLSFKRTQSYASHEMSGAPQFHAGSLNRSESDEQNENARRVIRTDGFYLTKKKGKRKKKEYKLN